jgi:hypothetical protein
MTNQATVAHPTLLKKRVEKNVITYAQTRLFLEMGALEKAVFLAKVGVFLASFGFIFPRLFSDGIEGTEY